MKINETLLINASIPSKLIPDGVYLYLILLWPILLLIICPFGVWANGLVIRTFLRMGLNDSVSISFFCLGLSDFAHVFSPLSNIAWHFLEFIEKKFDIFFKVENTVMSANVNTLASIFSSVTMYITTFLALQRCLCIVKPLQFKDMFSKKMTWCFMGCFSLLSALPPTAYFSAYGVAEITNPYTNISRYILTANPWLPEVNNYIGMPLFTILPIISLCLVIGSVIVMSVALKASIRFRKKTSRKNNAMPKSKPIDEESTEDERQVSKERVAIIQVALLSAIFVVTNIPKAGLSLGASVFPELSLDIVYYNIFRVIIGIRLCCDYLNSAVNFFIYYKYNSKFRKLCFAPRNKLVQETKRPF